MAISAADLKIDHVTIAGRELKPMQAALAAAGIPTVYGGAHANSVTEMALASFPDGSYLEAIAVRQGAAVDAVARHEWAAFLEQSGMPCAWAVQSADLAADAARLRAAGVAVGAPVAAGRTRPDGVRLQWETVNLGTDTRGSFLPFLIHDLTARNLRAFPRGKPVTGDLDGLTYVVVGVRKLEEAVARYRAAFGMAAPVRQTDREFGADLARLDGPVILAQPLTQDSWLAQRIGRYGEGPCAFILSGKARTGPRVRWFGREITWLAPEKLGWHLGVVAR
jgi:hypothetical protein